MEASITSRGEDLAAPLAGRAQRMASRRRGVHPANLRERLDAHTGDFAVKSTARFIADHLDGMSPSALEEHEVARFRELYGEWAEPAIAALESVGYGAPKPRTERRFRAHGARREQNLSGLVGKLPRALALRLPTSAETHRTGAMNGRDRWGEVSCSRTLRSSHLLVLAAAGGLWARRARDGETFVDLTASELSYLDSGRARVGGRDVAEVVRCLTDLDQLEVTASVDRNRQGDAASAAHAIPSSPVVKVERDLRGQMVSLEEYANALGSADAELARDAIEVDEDAPRHATLRIHLADWFLDELRHPERRAVLINFDIWSHLRPSARRLYAFLQALGRDPHDGMLRFWLADPQRFTFGLRGKRRHLWAQSLRDDLTAVVHADKRYRHWHPYGHPSGFPGFAVEALDKVASAPTAQALATKAPPKRPMRLRGAHARLRRAKIGRLREVGVAQLEPTHRRLVGDEQALREATEIREAITASLSEAGRSRSLEADPSRRRREAQHPPDRAGP